MHSRRRLAFSGLANELDDDVLLAGVDALAAAAITEGGGVCVLGAGASEMRERGALLEAVIFGVFAGAMPEFSDSRKSEGGCGGTRRAVHRGSGGA